MNNLQLFNHDCRSMHELPDESVQAVVTSPPYYQLRTYAGEQMIPEWACSFGQEKTLQEYIAHSLEILQEVWRVLKPSGVCWWNVADSYCSQPGNGRGGGEKLQGATPHYSAGPRDGDNLKPKDLCLVPERFAIGAQEAGWWVRSRITWCKSSGMPESVKDRPTDSTETIFMLTKSARYYYDNAAVREPLAESTIARLSQDVEHQEGSHRAIGKTNGTMKCRVSGWHGSKFNDPRDLEVHPDAGMTEREELPGHNLRNWWVLPTEAAFNGGHLAVFPQKIPETCIKAATKEGDTVLDPFAGSGTTLFVARKMGRKAVGYEISSEYCKLIEERNAQAVLL